jgi:hypothetical protein
MSGLKRRVKPHVLDLLDLLHVPHGFSRTPAVYESLATLSRPPQSAPDGPAVLVLSFRGAWLLHGTWEALVAEALRRRGARPVLFVCSGGLPQTLPGRAPACGIASSHQAGPNCANCLDCGLSIAASLHLPVLRLDDFVDGRRVRELAALVDASSGSEVRALHHHGLPIGQYVLNSARWFLCVSDLDGVAEGDAVMRAFAKSALVVAHAAPALLDRVRPEAVFLLNGLFFAERIVKAEAERRGIRVVSYEVGFIPDTLCFSEDVPGYYDIGPLWERVKDRPLGPAQANRLDDYMADRRKGRRSPFNYWPTLTEDERAILSSLRLAPDRPTAVLFTNITWDSAAQDRDRAFPDMYAWVVESIRLFASRPDAQLVVRIHPAEVRVPGWQTRDPVGTRLRATFPRLPANVRVVPAESDVSSYSLMTLSRCGLVYTSTTGLEMATEGMPVVVAGIVHYGGKGFTLDPSSIDEYEQEVARALEADRDPVVRDLARRYAYALFFRYFHPFPIVAENAPDFIPTLRASEPGVLDPGGDPTLDGICRAIRSGGAFYGPE